MASLIPFTPLPSGSTPMFCAYRSFGTLLTRVILSSPSEGCSAGARAHGVVVSPCWFTRACWRLPAPPPEELNSSHAQVVRVSLPPGWHLTFVHVYLSPGLSSADWDVTRKLVAQVMPQAGPHLLLLCGDLNAVLASERGRVARALTSGHSWDQLYCPYPLGEPTNVVTRQGSVSRREIEYVLIHRASPASSVRQLVHPGVSTHDALYCAVGLTPDFHLPRPFQAAPSIVTS